MKIEYEYQFGLPRNIIWKYMKDEKVLRNALPGCKSFVQTSKGVYQAELIIKIGPIQDFMTLEIRLDEEKAPSYFRLCVKGNGNVGEIIGQADLSLKETQGASKLACKAEAQVTGALALAGQRLLDSGASKGLDSFFQKLEREIKRKIYQMKKKSRGYR